MSSELPSLGGDTDETAAGAVDGLADALDQLDEPRSGAVDESVLPEFEIEETGDEIESTRPALQALNEQQLEALREFRDEGVEHRPALLRWLLRLQYRTLGRLPDYWYSHIATDPTALACVLTGETRGVYNRRGETKITPADAWCTRRRLVARYLRPACREAFRFLRPKAAEYLEGNRDPEKMAALAMRPALDEHYSRQERAIAEFHEGFDSVAVLDEWLQRLDAATFGTMKAVEPDFDYQLTTSRLQPELTTCSEPMYVEERERIIAWNLLPACNVAVRELADQAGESQDEEKTASSGVEL
ncbi:hypothetical protein [Halobaculum rubrum]|uniref:hypothetical protein n=1 Tax=Halobaculum rubrum TaxID=2872158 RepID=UPI001CA4010C|nr:hypothetical protein [Halobaculum rubrum]QZX98733.1 hypothetical protein K6T25_10655 [Halobaculum rubrum]